MTSEQEAALTRPIIGIENRTAQEAFDIMADRIRSFLANRAQPAPSAVQDDGLREALEAAFEFLGGVDDAAEIRDTILAALAAHQPPALQ